MNLPRIPRPAERTRAGAAGFEPGGPAVVACWGAAACLVLCVGCTRPPDPVDPQGPLKEQIATLSGQLQQRQQQIEATQREFAQFRAQVARQGQVPPATQDLEFTVEKIELGWLSGGRGHHGTGGDDRIRLFVFPIDRQGHTVKRLGTLVVRLHDPALPDKRRQIGAWRFDPAEAASQWASDVVAYGYRLDLKWQSGPPQHRNLRVEVDFTGLDGRRFSTAGSVRVVLATSPTSAPTSRAR